MNTLARPLALVRLAAFVVVAPSGAHFLLTERVAVAQPAFQAPPVLSARELLTDLRPNRVRFAGRASMRFRQAQADW